MTNLKNEAAKITNEHVGREVFPIKQSAKEMLSYAMQTWLGLQYDPEISIHDIYYGCCVSSALQHGIRDRHFGTAIDCIGELEQRLAVMREALEFYADPDTYHATSLFCDPPCGDIRFDYSEDHGGDYERPMLGKKAREAIKQSEGGV